MSETIKSCAQALFALCVSEQNNIKISNLALFMLTHVRSHNSLTTSYEFIVSINVMNEIRCHELKQH